MNVRLAKIGVVLGLGMLLARAPHAWAQERVPDTPAHDAALQNFLDPEDEKAG